MTEWDYKSTVDPVKKAAREKKNKHASDVAMTNPEMAKHLISRAFYDNFPEFVDKHWCEINDGRDYLDQDKMVDYTVTNPPFTPRKLLWSFCQKAMDTTRKEIYFLINLNCMNVFTTRRLGEMKEKCWYITSQHIVSDRRWFGRYVFLRMTRRKSDYFTWFDGKAF
jgi:hypothetical protein